MELDAVLRVLASFEREGVDYAVFGGVALNLHGIPRATEDLDVFVRPEVENVERLCRALKSVFDDPNVDEIDVEELVGEYPAVRYYPPSSEGEDEFYLDILTRLGEFADFDRLEIESVEIQGVKIRLVSPRTLYWMKRDTVRDKDRVDASYIREKFDLNDDDFKEGGQD